MAILGSRVISNVSTRGAHAKALICRGSRYGRKQVKTGNVCHEWTAVDPGLLLSWICEKAIGTIFSPWVWNETGLMLTLSKLISLCEFQLFVCKMGIIMLAPIVGWAQNAVYKAQSHGSFYRATHECPSGTSSPKVNLSTALPLPPCLLHSKHSNWNHRNHYWLPFPSTSIFNWTCKCCPNCLLNISNFVPR